MLAYGFSFFVKSVSVNIRSENNYLISVQDSVFVQYRREYTSNYRYWRTVFSTSMTIYSQLLGDFRQNDFCEFHLRSKKIPEEYRKDRLCTYNFKQWLVLFTLKTSFTLAHEKLHTHFHSPQPQDSIILCTHRARY